MDNCVCGGGGLFFVNLLCELNKFEFFKGVQNPRPPPQDLHLVMLSMQTRYLQLILLPSPSSIFKICACRSTVLHDLLRVLKKR